MKKTIIAVAVKSIMKRMSYFNYESVATVKQQRAFRYSKEARDIFRGKMGFQPAIKSRYSKTGGEKFDERFTPAAASINHLRWSSYFGIERDKDAETLGANNVITHDLLIKTTSQKIIFKEQKISERFMNDIKELSFDLKFYDACKNPFGLPENQENFIVIREEAKSVFTPEIVRKLKFVLSVSVIFDDIITPELPNAIAIGKMASRVIDYFKGEFHAK